METLKHEIAEQLLTATGHRPQIVALSPIGGGDINRCYRVDTNEQVFFVKINSASLADLFIGEAAALEELGQCAALQTPQVIAVGSNQNRAFLIMSFLELKVLDESGAARLGEGLAELHHISATRFGWKHDNTIGTTPQLNSPMDNWAEFFRQNRLIPQFERAVSNGLSNQFQDLCDLLLAGLHEFFFDYTPVPSLLHGDLWAGNAAVDTRGRPVIYDPALYYGDREADIAMTELFGGFPPAFHEAYNGAWPLDSGYPDRRTLYNLYHVMNHFNLFGGGYATQAMAMLRQLTSRID